MWAFWDSLILFFLRLFNQFFIQHPAVRAQAISCHLRVNIVNIQDTAHQQMEKNGPSALQNWQIIIIFRWSDVSPKVKSWSRQHRQFTQRWSLYEECWWCPFMEIKPKSLVSIIIMFSCEGHYLLLIHCLFKSYNHLHLWVCTRKLHLKC